MKRWFAVKIIESTGDGCSYPHSVAPIHFTVRVYGSVKVERWGTEEKGREGKRREGEEEKRREREGEEEKRRKEKKREGITVCVSGRVQLVKR